MLFQGKPAWKVTVRRHTFGEANSLDSVIDYTVNRPTQHSPTGFEGSRYYLLGVYERAHGIEDLMGTVHEVFRATFSGYGMPVPMWSPPAC